MTAIAARAGADAPAAHRAILGTMCAAMLQDGQTAHASAPGGAAALAATWSTWETEPTGSPRSPVFQRRHCSVVADATLYYRDALRDALRAKGATAPLESSAELILAAYEAFGSDCAARLEGDFAFVLWDDERQSLFAARDFIGKRPLHYSAAEGTITLASTVNGVVADSTVSRALDLGALAAAASALWVHFPETCYASVRELRAGHQLEWDLRNGARVTRFWSLPDRLDPRPSSTDEAASELRELLTRAVDERMSPSGTTTVTLSGGWDSTAVWGSGQRALQQHPGPARKLQPVSISYPVGDPGREDELITEAAAFWHATPAWLDSTGIDMFADVRELSARRQEPSAHPYEQWHRALARASRNAGARVVLDGSGGDQLFQVSDVYVADLVRRGRFVTARREWKARGGAGFRSFLSTGVRPSLSDRTLRFLAAVRGAGRPAHYLDRTPSPWFRRDFLDREGVVERELAARPALPRSSTVLAEMHAYLTYPFFARTTSRVALFLLDEGVEARSPLLDNRVVQFAAGRPWYERAHGPETKILLRRAMKGLLPDSLLAPRTHRTGVTSGFFARSLLGPGRALIDKLVTDPVLAQLGIVDPTILRRGWDYYLRTANEETGGRLYFTIMTELWLRQHHPVTNS